MSASDEAKADTMCCAYCGIAESDDIELKKCADCDLVRYCSDKCQREHRPKHEQACKERAVELRDEILFRQPECSSIGDCPICFLPLPLDLEKSILKACCSKIFCGGCAYANFIREMEERLQHTCPFCRQPRPETDEGYKKNLMKRVAANDPIALHEVGMIHYEEGNYESSFEYFTKAAELGNVDAHLDLSILYREGKGVEKDEKRETYHLEEAAIAGNLNARYDLACHEVENKRFERAAKHFIIAANLGHDESIQRLKDCFKWGAVSKEDFAAALRAHQAAVNATKSPQREAAAKANAAGEIRFSFVS
jgi:tetratricopeptide (TPR) repeat protein